MTKLPLNGKKILYIDAIYLTVPFHDVLRDTGGAYVRTWENSGLFPLSRFRLVLSLPWDLTIIEPFVFGAEDIDLVGCLLKDRDVPILITSVSDRRSFGFDTLCKPLLPTEVYTKVLEILL